jgi:hypothetical protein
MEAIALRALQVLSVGDRQRIGTIELTDNGELHITPRGVQGLIDRMAKTRGWNSREVFKNPQRLEQRLSSDSPRIVDRGSSMA